LLIGTNDLAAHRSPELTVDGIRANLVLLRERLPEARILLLGLLPREQFPDAPLHRAVAQVNRLIPDCEIGDALLVSDGRLSEAVSPDWLHFSERGYALLAASLEPLLDRVLVCRRLLLPGADAVAPVVGLVDVLLPLFAIAPQPSVDHPRSQCLSTKRYSMDLPQLLTRQGRTEIPVPLANDRQRRFPPRLWLAPLAAAPSSVRD
jgi:GDSL-like Lipase/Acylhydrolase family